MGLLDRLRGYRKARDEKRIAKSLATIKNPKAIKEDRSLAIQYFADLGEVHTAVPALLQRFEYSLEHGINDTREKEAAMAGIVGYGPEALPYVKEHLLATSRIAWPIKVLKALGEEAEVIEILKAALDFGDVTFDQAKVDKNYDILCYLVDYKLPDFVPKLAHFLNDPDERVRFACTEVLIEQDHEDVPRLLEPFLGDRSAENTRIRQAVFQAFRERGWKIVDPGKYPGGRIADDLFVNASGELVAPPAYHQ